MSQKRIEEDLQREGQTVDKIKRSLDRIKEQQSKPNRADSRAAAALTDSSEHFQGLITKRKTS